MVAAESIQRAVESLAPGERLLIAASGGRDSMVLLDAMVRWRPELVAGVATFDHGTGEFARNAVQLVLDITKKRGVPFVHGAARDLPPTEAAWRRARWEFLRESAVVMQAHVATAHTLDDHIETVFIRLLRDSGPRGLAGLLAGGDIVRPLLTAERSVVSSYAAKFGIDFLDDPSNQSRRYLRNRVRLDLLPACEKIRPGFSRDLLRLSERAADWRRGVERLVSTLEPWHENRSVFVRVDAILAYEQDARAILWPAIAARAGIALDRRGTERLAAFSTREGRVQLSGGHQVVRRKHAFEVRPAAQLHG